MVPSRPRSSAPSPEDLFRGLRSAIEPSRGAEEIINRRIRAKLRVPDLLNEAKESITPPAEAPSRVWQIIAASLSPLSTPGFWDRLRSALTPQEDVSSFILQRMTLRLKVARVPVASRIPRLLTWGVTALVLMFIIRTSPVLFLPRSVAESTAMVFPTRGEVLVLTNGLYQPYPHEVQVKKSALLQTAEDDAATFVAFDDVVVRMDPNTTLAVHSIADRPALPTYHADMSLNDGRVWIQSLVPENMAGITIAFDSGTVRLHEGSISLTGDSVTTWNRGAVVWHQGRQIQLLEGQRLTLGAGSLRLENVRPDEYDDSWVRENLKRDATRRLDLAQMQKERRAAAAGILPNSRLYPLKKAAEAVDVLLTFDQQAKAQKLLDHANTRLNEAVALLEDGDPQAAQPLQDFRDTVIAVATGSGDSVVQDLVKFQVATAAADISALLPGDEAYSLKEAVLKVNEEVANVQSELTSTDQDLDGVEEASDGKETPTTGDRVQGMVLVDRLSALKLKTLEEGTDPEALALEYEEIKASVASNTSLDLEVRRELEESIARIAPLFAKEEAVEEEFIASPASEASPRDPAEIALAIRRRVIRASNNIRENVKHLERELISLRGHENNGPILRALLTQFSGDLQYIVEREIMNRRSEIQRQLHEAAPELTVDN